MTSQQRAIRASYDKEYITVYQAFSAEIAEAAVREQKLDASPAYDVYRGYTWFKPSFCWMMYRCGYTYKDDQQSNVLALRIKHANFKKIMQQAVLAEKPHGKDCPIVQWDPERSPRIGRLEYRSLQVGMPRLLVKQWTEEWVESVEDVTKMARALKAKLDEDDKIAAEELVKSGLLPVERPYDMPDSIRKKLEMD